MTHTKAQIQDLTRHNHEFENYFRNTIIPQLFVDGNMRLQKFTPPAMKQFSLSASDVGRPINEIRDNFRFPSIEENIRHVVECNEILEKEIQTTDFRWYQMNIIPYVRITDNVIDGVIITFVEITTRIKDLQDLEKLLADHEILLDTISHDIKNPLTSLRVAVGMLSDISPGDEHQFRTLLNNVEGALFKMNKVITDLTDVRQGEHKYKAEAELLNFEHILEDVRLTLSDNISAARAIIITDIQVSELKFTRRKLRSVIYNLINNAIKFRSPDRRVEIKVSTKAENGNILIIVSDNGVGIEKQKLPHIFSKYYRVENKIEGSGIGLYLVREIVNSSGGQISVNSTPGKGSEFRILLENQAM